MESLDHKSSVEKQFNSLLHHAVVTSGAEITPDDNPLIAFMDSIKPTRSMFERLEKAPSSQERYEIRLINEVETLDTNWFNLLTEEEFEDFFTLTDELSALDSREVEKVDDVVSLWVISRPCHQLSRQMSVRLLYSKITLWDRDGIASYIIWEGLRANNVAAVKVGLSKKQFLMTRAECLRLFFDSNELVKNEAMGNVVISPRFLVQLPKVVEFLLKHYPKYFRVNFYLDIEIKSIYLCSERIFISGK